MLVTADDLGLQLGSYGETAIETPNLDELARDGVRFEVAWAADASCSPSRAALFTGLHSHATGQLGLMAAGFSLHPHLPERTIPNLLKGAGYRTGIVGKLHVAPEDAFDFDLRLKKGRATRNVVQVGRMVDTFLAKTGSEPFFLMVNYSDPHPFRDLEEGGKRWHYPAQFEGLPVDPLTPAAVRPLPFQRVDTPAQRRRIAGYLNAVRRLDAGFGMLMEVLAAHGHLETTLILFLGDHGPPFARAKTTLYEAGVRVPFIVRWPGVSEAGSREAMVSTLDVLPTILDATGVTPPGPLHGRSLRPVLAADAPDWREYLMAEFHYHQAGYYFPRRAIRDRRYKLIHNLLAGRAEVATAIDGDTANAASKWGRYEGTPVRGAFATFANPPEIELYDLAADPAEFHDLSGDDEMAAVRERLLAALLAHRRRTDDPFLSDEFVRGADRGGVAPPPRP